MPELLSTRYATSLAPESVGKTQTSRVETSSAPDASNCSAWSASRNASATAGDAAPALGSRRNSPRASVPCVPQDGATAVGLGKGDSVFGLRVPQLDHNGQSCVVCVGCVEPVPDGWEVGRDHPLGVLRVRAGLRPSGDPCPRDVELEVRWLLGVRFDACGVDKGGVQKDAWLQNHPARRITSQRRGKRKGLATRRVALCTSTCAPTAIELRQRTFLFGHALRISMFWIFYWTSYNSSIALRLLKD